MRERAAVAVGHCLSYGEGMTFWPLREVVTALVGEADGESSHDGQSGLLRLLEEGDEAAVVVERVAARWGGRSPPPTRRGPSGPCVSCWRRPPSSARW